MGSVSLSSDSSLVLLLLLRLKGEVKFHGEDAEKAPVLMDLVHDHLCYRVLILLGFLAFFAQDVGTLHCFVGLGNTSKKREMKVYECPEGKFYVCAKMYGKGMGDQIKRYCEAIAREDYNNLVDQEHFAENNSVDDDPTCWDTIHNGRKVRVCICTSDKCNSSHKLTKNHWLMMTLTTLTVVAVFAGGLPMN